MALIQCQLFAESLGVSTDITLILPEHSPLRASRNGKLPVLYLLHGRGADHSEWTRHSSIERLAEARGIAVVMPSAGRSYYMDMQQGGSYFTYISEELPAFVKSLFPISDRREDTFVTGVSMGGYGAFKLGLRYPERYAAAASLSGGLDLASRVRGEGNFTPAEMQSIFGSPERIEGSDDDLLAVSRRLAASGTAFPQLYQCCGTEDFLYEANQTFRHTMKELDVQVTYEEEPGGHEWSYWDMKIKRVLEWLPVQV